MKKTTENRQNTRQMNANRRYKSSISGQSIPYEVWESGNGITKAIVPSQPIIAAYNSELKTPRTDRLPRAITSAMCAAKNADTVTTWLYLRISVDPAADLKPLQLALLYSYNATIATDKRGQYRITFAPRCNLSGIAKALRYIESAPAVKIASVYAVAIAPQEIDPAEVMAMNESAELKSVFTARFGHTVKSTRHGISASAEYTDSRAALATLSALNALATASASGKDASAATREALKQHRYTLNRGKRTA